MTADGHKRLFGIGASVAVVALGIYLTVRPPLRFFRNTTASMAPMLPVNSYIVVRTTRDVRVGDIIACRYPPNPKIAFAKRVVAAANDVVEIRDKKLFVNGRAVDEPYAVFEDPMVYPRLLALPEPYRSRDQFGPYRVPAHSWFTLGDNRDRSNDSRYWGSVPDKDVIGRVIWHT
jgi:signal peptidase I